MVSLDNKFLRFFFDFEVGFHQKSWFFVKVLITKQLI